jgi:hypothetical protein
MSSHAMGQVEEAYNCDYKYFVIQMLFYGRWWSRRVKQRRKSPVELGIVDTMRRNGQQSLRL